MDQIFQMDVHDIVERISTWELDSCNIFINRLYDLKWKKKSFTHSFQQIFIDPLLHSRHNWLLSNFFICEVSEVD